MRTIKVVRKAKPAPKRKSEGTHYICKDRAADPDKGCDTHVVLFVTPTEAMHPCPPGSRKQKPLVPR